MVGPRMSDQDKLAQLRAENEMLRQMVAALHEQLATALARIAELEQRRSRGQ